MRSQFPSFHWERHHFKALSVRPSGQSISWNLGSLQVCQTAKHEYKAEWWRALSELGASLWCSPFSFSENRTKLLFPAAGDETEYDFHSSSVLPNSLPPCWNRTSRASLLHRLHSACWGLQLDGASFYGFLIMMLENTVIAANCPHNFQALHLHHANLYLRCNWHKDAMKEKPWSFPEKALDKAILDFFPSPDLFSATSSQPDSDLTWPSCQGPCITVNIISLKKDGAQDGRHRPPVRKTARSACTPVLKAPIAPLAKLSYKHCVHACAYGAKGKSSNWNLTNRSQKPSSLFSLPAETSTTGATNRRLEKGLAPTSCWLQKRAWYHHWPAAARFARCVCSGHTTHPKPLLWLSYQHCMPHGLDYESLDNTLLP